MYDNLEILADFASSTVLTVLDQPRNIIDDALRAPTTPHRAPQAVIFPLTGSICQLPSSISEATSASRSRPSCAWVACSMPSSRKAHRGGAIRKKLLARLRTLVEQHYTVVFGAEFPAHART